MDALERARTGAPNEHDPRAPPVQAGGQALLLGLFRLVSSSSAALRSCVPLPSALLAPVLTF
eukprot:648578-Amphidinium_carterae.1